MAITRVPSPQGPEGGPTALQLLATAVGTAIGTIITWLIKSQTGC